MQNGKGDDRRPSAVPQEVVDANWQAAFGEQPRATGRQRSSVYHCTADCEAGQNPGNTGEAGTGSWHTQWVRDGEPPAPCPHCGAPVSSQPKGRGGGHSSEYLSDALGVAPNQIAEARAKFPHHQFAPDGRMVIKSPEHRKQVLRDIGYADYG